MNDVEKQKNTRCWYLHIKSLKFLLAGTTKIQKFSPRGGPNCLKWRAVNLRRPAVRGWNTQKFENLCYRFTRAQEIGPWLKIRLYRASVCSLLTYGCESWTPADRVMRKLNNINRCYPRLNHRPNGPGRSKISNIQFRLSPTYPGS